MSKNEAPRTKARGFLERNTERPKTHPLHEWRGFWPRMYKLIWVLAIVILISGCETVKEYAKGFAGISTKALEDNRKNAQVFVFKLEYNSCYDLAKQSLLNHGSYIYSEDRNKGLIAVYISQEDTTAVGVFFKKIDQANTQVEVSSASTYGKEFIAARVFAALKGEPDEKKAEASSK